VLGAWVAWLAAGRLTMYETSASARVEAGRAVHPVDAAAGGRVLATPGLRLDAAVRAGDVLVELDARAERIELARERERLAALQAQRAALASRLDAEGRVLAQARGAVDATARESAARVREARSAADLAGDEERRTAALADAGSVAQAELGRARSAAERASAEVDAALSTGAAAEARARQGVAETEARLGGLRSDAASLDAEVARSRAAARRWELEVERKTVRAPVAGRLARVEPVRAGEVLAAGARVADVVPADGRLRIVAELPVRATGRVRPGQTARLRLDGFPRTRHGSVVARVARIGAEPRGGRVRVECDVVSAPPSVPLQHGLAGTLEIEVGATSPAALFAWSVADAARGTKP
jgi:membrane fusion protein (multidrug efflux system)